MSSKRMLNTVWDITLPQIIDYDQVKDLEKLMYRHHILLNEFPSAAIMNKAPLMQPLAIYECAMCASHTNTIAHPNLDLCLTCYKNRADIKEYRERAVILLMSRCERCKKNFNSGVRLYNVRLCLKCMQQIGK